MADGLVLRPVLETDLPTLFEQRRDRVSNQMAAFTLPDPDNREAFMDHSLKNLHDPKVLWRAILLDGALVGSVAFFEMEGQASLAYWIDRAFWGRGIATRALTLFLQEARERPVYARVVEDNLGSRRVLEKCGFQIRGNARGFANARGHEVTELIFRRDDP
jgi:RimJ/RimL family protein N-acetyltransferase